MCFTSLAKEQDSSESTDSWVSRLLSRDGYECLSAVILLRFAAGFFVLVGLPGGGRFTFWHRRFLGARISVLRNTHG